MKFPGIPWYILGALAIVAIVAAVANAGGYRYYYPSRSYCYPTYTAPTYYAPPVYKAPEVKAPVYHNTYNYQQQPPILFNFITNAPAVQPLSNPGTQYGISSFSESVTFNPDLLASSLERSFETSRELIGEYGVVAQGVLQAQSLRDTKLAEVQKAALTVEAIRAAAQGVQSSQSYAPAPSVYQYDAVKGDLRHIKPRDVDSADLPPDPARLPQGQTMLQNKCYTCHGPDATGDGAAKFKFDVRDIGCKSYGKAMQAVTSGTMPPDGKLGEDEGLQIIEELNKFVQFTKE